MFQETMEAMKIMGIPDEEQIGMNMQGIKEGTGHVLRFFFFCHSFFFALNLFVSFLCRDFVGFVLLVSIPVPPALSEQCAIK